MKSWWGTNHTAPESGRRGTCCCSCKTAPSMQSESQQWLPQWLEQNIRPPMTPSRRNLSSPSSSFPPWFFSPYHWQCLRWGNWQIERRPGQSRGRRWSVCRTCPAGICPSALAGRTGPAAVLLLHLCGAVNITNIFQLQSGLNHQLQMNDWHQKLEHCQIWHMKSNISVKMKWKNGGRGKMEDNANA